MKTYANLGVIIVDADVLIDWENRWRIDQYSFENIDKTLDVVGKYIFPYIPYFEFWIPKFVIMEVGKVKGGRRFLKTLKKKTRIVKDCCIKNSESEVIESGKNFLNKNYKNMGEIDAVLQLKKILKGDVYRLKKCKYYFPLKIEAKILTSDKGFLEFIRKNHTEIICYVVLWNDVVSNNFILKHLYPKRVVDRIISQP